jgi:hypothetical protein
MWNILHNETRNQCGVMVTIFPNNEDNNIVSLSFLVRGFNVAWSRTPIWILSLWKMHLCLGGIDDSCRRHLHCTKRSAVQVCGGIWRLLSSTPPIATWSRLGLGGADSQSGSLGKAPASHYSPYTQIKGNIDDSRRRCNSWVLEAPAA